ncbi:MAG: tetratricopeptide repeat protein [Pyrinomonadaceae bacterium]
MHKESILVGVIGLLAGLIAGFMIANSLNKGGTVSVPSVTPSAAAQSGSLPEGHPAVPPGGTTTGGAMQPEVQAMIEKAKQFPNDFDAQIAAAEKYNQIERYDDAIVYLKRANAIKPDNREVVVHLGNANFDSNHFEEAEKWYTAALTKKADDVNVRTDLGLTFVFRTPPNYDRAIQELDRSLALDPNHVQTLQNLTVVYTKKGDAAKALAALARLETVAPGNEGIAKLKADIQAIGSK